MMIVIVNVHLIAIPLPVAAPIDVISCYDPVGAIVEDDIAGTIVDGAGNKALANMLVMAAGIRTARNDAGMLVVPAAVVVFIPALVLAIIMAVVVIAIAVLFLSLVLPIVVAIITVAVIVAILSWRGNRDSGRQHEQRKSAK